MCCYGVSFATQAAMAGIELTALEIKRRLAVDFRAVLGPGEFPPFEESRFDVAVETEASEEDVQRVKQLADERCPAIWAMTNQVAHSTVATKL